MEPTLLDLEHWIRNLELIEGIVYLAGAILMIVVGWVQRTWYNWRMSDEERQQVEAWRRGPFRLPTSRMSADR